MQQQATVRGVTVSTRCETVDEFIAEFRDRCDEQSIVINVAEPRVAGTECAFAILLANKKPVLAGTFVVLDVFKDKNNAFKRCGMRLGIKRLGIESEEVFAALTAARVAGKRKATELGFRPLPARPTMALPIVSANIAVADVAARAAPPAPSLVRSVTTAATNDGAAIVSSRRMTQRGLRVEAPHEVPRAQPLLPSMQIPPIDKEPRERSVRAMPTTTGRDRLGQKKQTNSPVAIFAEGSGDTRQPIEAKAITETRTPGSSYILPANPFSDVSDASLEGFVECRLFEAHPSDDLPASAGLAHGTVVEPADRAATVEAEVDDDPTQPIEMPMLIAAGQITRGAEDVERPAPSPAHVETTDTPKPLPDLGGGELNVDAHAAKPSRRPRMRLLLAVVLGAAVAVVAATMPVRSAVAVTPAVAVSAEAIAVRGTGTEQVEAAPASTSDAPIAQQPIHAVLVKTYPSGAAVTVGDRSFGTTPTYIKIPGNTPVEVRIARPGFKPIERVVTSKRRYDEVFVPLQPNRARKTAPARQTSGTEKQSPANLLEL